MKKFTKLQWTTIILLLLYIAWEIYVHIWMRTETTVPIRVDLFIIIPILIIMIILSLIQEFRKRK